MGKLIVTMWMSLDGYIAGPDGDMSWIRVDDEMGAYEGGLVGAADTLVLGRVTYESFAGAWPFVPDSPAASEGEKEYARTLNALRKVVFLRTLDRADWRNTTLRRAIDPDEIAALKQETARDLVIPRLIVMCCARGRRDRDGGPNARHDESSETARRGHIWTEKRARAHRSMTVSRPPHETDKHSSKTSGQPYAPPPRTRRRR